MGDNIRSKTKLGYHISTKIISILLVLLLTTTAFSSVLSVQGSAGSVREKINEALDRISEDGNTDASSTGAAANAPSQNTQLKDALKELSMLKREKAPIFTIVTKYNGTETTTPLRRLLPTAIDINGDDKNDIRVWVFRTPGIDLLPPAACIKTTLLVRRLNDNIKNGPFEIYLQYTPKIISKLSNKALPSIRIGYQTPAGSEVPKTCIVTHKNIPHLLYPKLETTHKVAINPVSIIGKSQLNLLFSIVDMENNTVNSELTIQVNHSPAVRNEISFGMSKERLIGRGQTLELSRKGTKSSNVTIIIKDTTKADNGFVKIENIPKKITLSWRLSTKGHIELKTYGSGTGPVSAAVDGAIALGFVPTTGVNFRLGWDVNRLTLLGTLRSINKGKGFNLEIDAKGSATLSNLYVNMPDKLGLTASLFSFNLKGGVDAGKVIINPNPGADTVAMNVENVDVVLKDCNINLVAAEQPVKPTISITYPGNGATVSGIVAITGTASAPPGTEIKSVTISIDGGDSILVDGTTAWSYNLGTTSLPNGNHTINVQSFDGKSYSDKYTIPVMVNNPGNNWKPSVKITAPSNLQILKGVVRITGTANDVDGDKLTVNLTIINNLEIPSLGKIFKETDATVTVDSNGKWYYDLDTNDITSGLYTIYANSYDGKYDSNSDSVTVWIKLKCNLDFTISQASINVTNFNLKYDSSGNVTNLGISSFVASGSGSVKVADGAIYADISGSLKLNGFSALKKNETNVTKLSVENLNADLLGYGEAILSQSEIGLEINASVSLDFDSLYIADIPLLETLDLGAFTLSGKGLISAGIKKLNVNDIEIGGYGDRDNVTMEATDLLLNVSGQKQNYFLAGADKIELTGNGNISLLDNSIEVKGSLDKFNVDNFYIQGDLAKLAFSGSVNRTRDASLKIDFTNLLNFNISYDGEKSLEITNPKVVLDSAQGTIIAFADSITVSRQGYAGFSYYKEDLSATCWVNISEVCFTALSLSLDDLSVYAGDICGTGTFCFTLSSVISIVYGSDWINITIGGKGMAHIIAHANIYSNEVYGRLDVDVLFNNGNGTFVINVSGIPNNIAVYMDGSAALDLDAFGLLLRDKTDASDLVNISLDSLDGNFVVHANEGVWEIDTAHGISVEKLFFTIFLRSSQTFFSINVDSIETSGGGIISIDKTNKIITYTSGDDTDKTISLVGLDVIAGSFNAIIDDMNLSLSGTDTTISLSSFDNITKIEASYGDNGQLNLNTLWVYLPTLPVEIRIHELEMTGPFVATVVNGESMPLTIQTSGTITFEEFSILTILGLINKADFYGGKIESSDNPNSISIGVTTNGGIKLHADAAVQIHFDTIIIHDKTLLPDLNLSLGGKGTIVLDLSSIGLSLSPLLISAEVNFSEYTTLSFKITPYLIQKLRNIFDKSVGHLVNHSLVLTFEPGDFYLNLRISDGFDILLMSTSLITIGIEDPILKRINCSISAEGYVEAHISKNSNENDNSTSISISGSKIVGMFKFSRYRLINGEQVERYCAFQGNGSGYMSWSNNSDGTQHVVASWVGYLTFIKTVDGFIDAKTIMLYLQDVDIDISFKHYVGGAIKLVWQLLDDTKVGIWKQLIDDTWVQIWPLWSNPPSPPSEGVTTLVSGLNIGSFEIIPGDKPSFTAWYVPASITNNMIQWAGSMPQSNPDDQGQQGGEQYPQGQEEMPGQQYNNGQGAAPLGYGQNGGQGGTYTFTLNYGDGNSQTFPVSYSGIPAPIKVDLGNHLYTALGTYVVTLTVTGDPDAENAAVDTLTINVAENYLSVLPETINFDYKDVGNDGKIHGSFVIYNLANKTYSGNYVLDWSLTNSNRWGTNWTFEPSSGSLQPESKQTVKVSFTPPLSKGDYYNKSGNGVVVVNDNNPDENSVVNFTLNYGLIELLPDYPMVLYMPSGGTAILDDAFWVYRTRWEKNDDGVSWQVCKNSFTPGMVTFIPDGGVIPRGEGPVPVDMKVTASDGVYKGTVKVCRIGDPADNDTVNITLVVGMNGQLNINLIHDEDGIFEGDQFLVNLTDAKTSQPISGATVTYESYNGSITYSTNTTNANGLAGFTAAEAPTVPGYIDCKVHVDAIGYDSSEEIFWVYDTNAHIRGFVYDAVTHDQIGNAKVEANPGGYVTYTIGVGINPGYYGLTLSPGTYSITVSKAGYQATTVDNIVVPRGSYMFLDNIYLAPATPGGHIMGYVFDNYNNPIMGATVSTDGASDVTDYTGRYYLTVSPGTHTVTVTVDNYQSDSVIVTVNDGETITHDFHLIPDGGLYGYIAGYVRDEVTGQPIPGANVSTSWNATSIVYAITNEAGYYNLTVVSGNNGGYGYYVQVKANDYLTTYQYVSWINGGETIIVNFTLSEANPIWISPTGYTDNDWKYEQRAKDGDTDTGAYWNKWGDTDQCDEPLVLKLSSPINIKGFRINAKGYDHLNQMKLVFKKGGTEKVTVTYDGVGSWYTHPYWQQGHFSGNIYDVDTVEIWFSLEDGYTFGGLFNYHWAVVYEFDFWQAS